MRRGDYRVDSELQVGGAGLILTWMTYTQYGFILLSVISHTPTPSYITW